MVQGSPSGNQPASHPGPSSPAHQITSQEVPEWLAGSAVQEITTHRTDAESARSVREHGFLLGRARSDAGWGQGFYSSNLSDPQYGDTAVQVAVRLRRPLLIEDPIRGAEQVDDLLARAGSEDIRATLVAAGYDGVVVQYKHLGRYVVVAYFEEQVKVVVEE